MTELCFNTMNRSSFLLGSENPRLEQQIAAAANTGFTLFGPDYYSICHYREHIGSVEALALQIEQAGMRCFELPVLQVDDVDQLRNDAQAMLGVAKILKPDFLQVNINCQTDNRLLAELRNIADMYAQFGVKLALEYLPWLPQLKSINDSRLFLEAVAHPGFGIVVDTWHFTHSEDSWEDLQALPIEQVSYVQFDDHPPLQTDDLIAETVGRRVMPGQGSFELERFCKIFQDKGYEGPVSCEVLSDQTRNMDIAAFAQQLYTTSRVYWA